MITPTILADAYARNVMIIQQQTAGLSDADSLVQLPFRGNCMNWIVGHIVTNRHNVLKLLNGEFPAEAARMQRYVRESQPITGPEAGVLPLAELLALLALAQTQLAARLEELTPAALAESVAFFGNRSMSVAEWLMFFYFHDSYHTGQTEILRQAAGKNDKII